MASRLCGLEGVQIRVNPPGNLDLEALRPRLEQRTGTPWKLTPLALSGEDGRLRIMHLPGRPGAPARRHQPGAGPRLVYRSGGMLG